MDERSLEVRMEPRNSFRGKTDGRGRISLGKGYADRRAVLAITEAVDAKPGDESEDLKTPENVEVPLSDIYEGRTDGRGRFGFGAPLGDKLLTGVVLNVEETYEVEEGEDAVEVTIQPAGETIRFPLRGEIAGYGADRLLAVYALHDCVIGAYGLVDDVSQQFEGTLWFEGEVYNDFGDLDPFGQHGGTWQGKLERFGVDGADTVIWMAEDQEAP